MAVTATRLRPGRKVLLLLASLCAGCGAPAGAERFKPAPDLSRLALEAVLSQWSTGEPLAALTDRTPAVSVVDNLQLKRRPLASFEILGEVPGPARCFAVRLQLHEPDEEVRERYVVLGIDPLWVYRQEDYELISQWDHHMPPEPQPDDEKGNHESNESDE